MPIQTATTDNGKTLIIKLPERFDLDIQGEIREIYSNVGKEVNSYNIDFTNTQHLDSSAFGMLLLLRDELSSGSNDLHLINCSDDIKELLMVVKFDELFTIG